jgi:hypothetical protein
MTEDWRLLDLLAAAEERRRQPPKRPTVSEIFWYAVGRSKELGFDPEAVLAKRQGQRLGQSLKDARARVIVELRDQDATERDIGAVFGGRTQQSILALERQGRSL